MKLKFRIIFIRKITYLFICLLLAVISICGASEKVVDAKESKLYMTIIGERDVNEMYSKAKALIESGEHDVNALIRKKGKIRKSILGAAVGRQHLPLVKLILKHGANPSPILEYGCGPIGTALTYSNQEIVKILITYNADLSGQSCYEENEKGLSVLKVLLSSRLVEDATRIFAIEKHVEKGGGWAPLLLHRMLRKNKYEVAKRMLQLQPTAIDETTRKILEKSKSVKIRSLVDLLPKNQQVQSLNTNIRD